MAYCVSLDLLRRVGLFAAAALSSLVFVGVASAQQPKGKAAPAAPKQAAPAQNAKQQSPGWSVRCTNPGKGLTCRATQTVVLVKTRKLLLSASVSKPAEGKNAAMLLHLPLGLFNPAGATLAIDGAKPETLPIQTCDAKGCYAGAAVTPERLAAMSKGAKFTVTFQNLKKKKIAVPVPLKGFADAYKKL